jgi:hypothetical protein
MLAAELCFCLRPAFRVKILFNGLLVRCKPGILSPEPPEQAATTPCCTHRLQFCPETVSPIILGHLALTSGTLDKIEAEADSFARNTSVPDEAFLKITDQVQILTEIPFRQYKKSIYFAGDTN